MKPYRVELWAHYRGRAISWNVLDPDHFWDDEYAYVRLERRTDGVLYLQAVLMRHVFVQNNKVLLAPQWLLDNWQTFDPFARYDAMLELDLPDWLHDIMVVTESFIVDGCAVSKV